MNKRQPKYHTTVFPIEQAYTNIASSGDVQISPDRYIYKAPMQWASDSCPNKAIAVRRCIMLNRNNTFNLWVVINAEHSRLKRNIKVNNGKVTIRYNADNLPDDDVTALDGYIHSDTKTAAKRSLVFVKQIQITIAQNTTLDYVMNQIANALAAEQIQLAVWRLNEAGNGCVKSSETLTFRFRYKYDIITHELHMWINPMLADSSERFVTGDDKLTFRFYENTPTYYFDRPQNLLHFLNALPDIDNTESVIKSHLDSIWAHHCVCPWRLDGKKFDEDMCYNIARLLNCDVSDFDQQPSSPEDSLAHRYLYGSDVMYSPTGDPRIQLQADVPATESTQ